MHNFLNKFVMKIIQNKIIKRKKPFGVGWCYSLFSSALSSTKQFWCMGKKVDAGRLTIPSHADNRSGVVRCENRHPRPHALPLTDLYICLFLVRRGVLPHPPPPSPQPSFSNKIPDRGLPSTKKMTRGWAGGRDFHVSSRNLRALNLLWKMRVSS